jgi:protein Mpv17
MAFFAPLATTLFYLCQGTMESRPWRTDTEMQGIQERIGERLWPTVWKQWAVFAPAQVINLT